MPTPNFLSGPGSVGPQGLSSQWTCLLVVDVCVYYAAVPVSLLAGVCVCVAVPGRDTHLQVWWVCPCQVAGHT